MSRLMIPILLILLLLPLTSCAAQQDQLKAVASTLSQYYPQLKTQQVNPSPVAGVYEVVLQNNEIVYFAPATGHMFFGELWSAKGRNLTRDSKSVRLSSKQNMFPLDMAIKIGNGPNKIIEVTDPDCPFCRKSSDFFESREDSTRYIFLFPLDRLHPEADAKARYILSSEDQGAAYEDVFSGMYDDQPLPAFKDNGLLDSHRKIAAQGGITGTPQFWINGQHVSGFNPKQFEALLTK